MFREAFVLGIDAHGYTNRCDNAPRNVFAPWASLSISWTAMLKAVK